MKRMRSIHFIFVSMAMISLIFVISPMAQEKKEAEDLYTVKQGDTLWDISSKFLKDPFLWPKLWQRNPYITNPHWIYPGQPIRLSPLEDLKKAEPLPQEEPKKVAVEEKPKEPVAEVEIKKVEPPPLEKVPEGVVEARPTEEKATESKPGFFLEARSGGFLSEVDLPGIGIVLESKEGKVLMAQEDIIYLALKTADPVMIGDKFTVVRASEIVRHPITGRRIGKKVQILGNVRIIDTNGNGNFYTGKVIEAFDAIERGDRIHPYMKERMADVEKR